MAKQPKITEQEARDSLSEADRDLLIVKFSLLKEEDRKFTQWTGQRLWDFRRADPIIRQKIIAQALGVFPTQVSNAERVKGKIPASISAKLNGAYHAFIIRPNARFVHPVTGTAAEDELYSAFGKIRQFLIKYKPFMGKEQLSQGVEEFMTQNFDILTDLYCKATQLYRIKEMTS